MKTILFILALTGATLAAAQSGYCENFVIAPFTNSGGASDALATALYTETQTVLLERGCSTSATGAVRFPRPNPQTIWDLPETFIEELRADGAGNIVFGRFAQDSRKNLFLTLSFFNLETLARTVTKSIVISGQEAGAADLRTAAIREELLPQNGQVIAETTDSDPDDGEGEMVVEDPYNEMFPDSRYDQNPVSNPSPPDQTDDVPGPAGARENELFQKAVRQATEKSIKDYYAEFPNGRYISKVEGIACGKCMAGANNFCKLYMELFTGGACQDGVMTRLEDIAQKKGIRLDNSNWMRDVLSWIKEDGLDILTNAGKSKTVPTDNPKPDTKPKPTTPPTVSKYTITFTLNKSVTKLMVNGKPIALTATSSGAKQGKVSLQKGQYPVAVYTGAKKICSKTVQVSKNQTFNMPCKAAGPVLR